MNPNDLLLFACLAEQGSITKAALALDIPKSNVSRRLANLESKIGAKLVERTTRRFHLTDLGQNFYLHCRRIADELQEASSLVEEHQLDPSGSIRVTSSISIAQTIIAPNLTEFRQLYPNIEIDLRLTNRRVDLLAEGFDMALRVGKLDDSSMVSRRVGQISAKLFASPEYLKHRDPLIHPSQLQEHVLLPMSDAMAIRNYWTLASGSETINVPLITSLKINDFGTLGVVAANNGGVVCLHKQLVESLVSQGRLVNVLPEWRTPPINLFAVYPSRLGLSRRLRVFLDFLIKKTEQLTF